jgi:hypothetical protein
MNITIIIVSIGNILCFLIGAKIGQMVSKSETIKLDPIKAIKEEIKETKIEKENDIEKSKIEKQMFNIDNYDGTGLGQQDIE